MNIYFTGKKRLEQRVAPASIKKKTIEINTMETVCDTCGKIIHGRILTALNKSYHPEHFNCTQCKKPITSSKFQENSGNPYCESCYMDVFSKRCKSCKKPIKDKVITALGAEWHEEHFLCSYCKKPLAGTSFFERDGKPYCKDDYLEHFAGKCKLCKQPIETKAIIALDGKWHQECFRCVKCDNPITEDAFQVEDGQPVCAKCAT